MLTGVLFTAGWAVVAASNEYLVYDAGSTVLILPLIAGSVLLPIGIVYDLKISRQVKFFIVVASGALIFFLAFYLLTFLGIAIHGIGPR